MTTEKTSRDEESMWSVVSTLRVCRTSKAIPALLVAAALLSYSGSVAFARKAKVEEKSGTISGRVISDYATVPTATVHVWLNKKEVARSVVDPKGEFHFKLKPETYEIDAEAPRLRPKLSVRTIVIVHSDHETWANIEMVP